MRAARIALVGTGGLLLVWGAFVLVTTVRPVSIGGLAIWLAAAVVLHDGIASPVVVAVGAGMRASGRRIPPVVLAVVQVALLVGVLMTLIVLPEVRAKQLGPRNPTVLPFDYALRLGVMWAVIALVTALLIAVILAVRRRRASHGFTVVSGGREES